MQPNIVLIHADQHRFDCIGANGHLLVQTPNLDKLAAEGANFTHAFTPIPLCIPARNSLIHGQWTSGHLSICNWESEAPRPARDGLPSFSQSLREAGYHLGYVGKWHVHPQKTPFDYGFHEYVPEEDYPRWRAEQGIPPRPRTQGWFGEPDPYITPEQSRLGWEASHTIRLIQQFSQNDAPFFIRWDPYEPHLPNVVPEPYCSMYNPKDIAPWPSFPDPLVNKPYIQKQQRRTWQVDDWTWDNWSPIVARYLGEITLMDAQIGRVLCALEELGLAENTLVIYTADHGDMCGSHGMIDKHYILYDDVVRVPLLMRWPGVIQANTQQDTFVSSALDLAATFCDVAGACIPETFSGQSLLPVMKGEAAGNRQDIFSVYHGNQFGLYTQRMVRDREWKYVWNATAEDELYHLPSDPGEVHNLAFDPLYRAELTRLRHRLIDWMTDTQDLALNMWTTDQLLHDLKV